MPLKTTGELWKAREIVQGENCPTELLGLQTHFLAVQKLVDDTSGQNPSSTVKDVIEHFMDAWRLCSDLPHGHNLYLRPLYSVADIMSVLTSQIIRAFNLELLRRGFGGVFSSGHCVVSGPVGVGKSYLLDGLSQLLSLLFRSVLPITFDYEKTSSNFQPSSSRPMGVTISTLLATADACRTSVNPDEEATAIASHEPHHTIPSLVASFTSHHIFPLLILDEVSIWYSYDLPIANRLLSELRDFGRSRNVMAIVTGSSSCLRQQVFSEGRWAEHINLNHALFLVKDIRPVRTATALSEYLRSIRRGLPPDLTIPRLLKLSGGVGRNIDTVLDDPSVRSMQGSVHPRELLFDNVPFTMLINALLKISSISLITSSPLSGGASSASASAPELSVPHDQSDLPFESISRSTALHLVKSACNSVSEATSLLATWQDQGILYYNTEASSYELLFPSQAQELREWFADTSNQRRMDAMMMCVDGLPDGSLGHCAEALLRQRAYRLFPSGVQGGVLSVYDGAAMYTSTEGRTTRLADIGIETVLNKVIRWSAETGIEDFQIQSGHRRGRYIINGWQCKVPAMGSITTLGAERPVTVFAQKGVGSLKPIEYLLHTTFKAKVGICKLVSLLQASLPSSAIFEAGTLYLRTTGILSKMCTTHLETTHALFPISPELAAAVATRESTETKPVAVPRLDFSVSLQLDVQDGLSWTASMLPEDMSNLFLTAHFASR